MKTELGLHEELLLLALRDQKGTVESKAGMYLYALGGALLAELTLGGQITIHEGKRQFVDVVDSRRSGDELLGEALAKIAESRRRSAADWVTRFASIKRLKHRVAEGLCQRGVLRHSRDKVLLVFNRDTYPTLDPGPERRLVQRLRDAVLSDSLRLEERTVLLVALAHGTGLLSVHFDRKELKERKVRLDRIAQSDMGELVGGATFSAVRAAQAAAMAAITASTVITTTAAH